jgi:hypothetical protein
MSDVGDLSPPRSSGDQGAEGAVLSLTRFTVVSPLVIVTVTMVFEESSLFSSVRVCCPAGSASFEQGVVVQSTRPCTLSFADGFVMMVKKPGPLASPSDAAGLALELGAGFASAAGLALGLAVAVVLAVAAGAALFESSRSVVGVWADAEGARLVLAPLAAVTAGSAVAPSPSAAGIAADAPTTRSAAAAMPYGADSLPTP